MADQSREEKLKAARETFKQLQKKKAGGKAAPTKAKKPKDDESKATETMAPEPTLAPSVEASSPELNNQEPPAPLAEEVSTFASATKANELGLQELQSQLKSQDAVIASLQEQLSTSKFQEEKYRREISQHSISLSSKEKEITSLKSADSEKDSMISSLQLELGQLRDQLSVLKESSGAAPTPEQFLAITQERDALKSEIAKTQNILSKTQVDLKSLQNSFTALEKDTKTTHEALVSLRNEHGKLKDSHSSEIQKSRLTHSRAAELQIENKTLLARVEELKQKLVILTSEKLELVDRAESLDKELFKLRKQKDRQSRGSVELNTELDALIQGQETRQAIRETNQRTYSQFVGQEQSEGESMRDVNERKLKKGKDSGEFGREREMGFVVDLISGGAGGCGMCAGEILVL